MADMGMVIDHVRVFGFEPALRDMRNPKESWHLSDSLFYAESPYWPHSDVAPRAMAAPWETTPVAATARWDVRNLHAPEYPLIGPLDLKLACDLIRGGGAHRKFLREIGIWWTLLIPRAIWQEQDTYKVATVRNSCSTMHKLGSRDLTKTDFADGDVRTTTLSDLNDMGRCYRVWLKDKDDPEGVYHDWDDGQSYTGVPLLRHMKFTLPEGYLQRAGYVFNYEAALKMYYDRKDHRMREWSELGGTCDHIRQLPYMEQFLEAAQKQRG